MVLSVSLRVSQLWSITTKSTESPPSITGQPRSRPTKVHMDAMSVPRKSELAPAAALSLPRCIWMTKMGDVNYDAAVTQK